ncbi:hypothetical protein ACE6H2_010909 [Prunus campanulata]
MAVVTSPFKPMVVAMPLRFVPSSTETASHADPKLAEFEVMDLESQLLKIEKLRETPSKSRSRAVEESMDMIRIWQTTELDLDENIKAIDQLIKDLDLLHEE